MVEKPLCENATRHFDGTNRDIVHPLKGSDPTSVMLTQPWRLC